MRVFIIDDEEFVRTSLRDFLSKKFPDATVDLFETGEAALKNLNKIPDAVILDYYLDLNDTGAANGVEILKQIKDRLPTAYVVLLSGQESLAIASDTIKYGAYDYIVKGESAFYRLQLIINRIYGYNKRAAEAKLNKPFNVILVALLIAFIAWLLISRLR